MPKKAAVSSILPPSSLPFSELRSSAHFASTGRWRSCVLCRCRSGRDPASGYPLDCSRSASTLPSSAPAPSTTCSAASAKASRGRKLSQPMAAYPPRFRLGELRVVIQVVDIGAPRRSATRRLPSTSSLLALTTVAPSCFGRQRQLMPGLAAQQQLRRGQCHGSGKLKPPT